MIRTYIYPLLMLMTATLLIESCKCNKDEEVVCPTCPANEICEEGSCTCPEGYGYRYGVCVKLAAENPSDDPQPWGNKYIAMKGCFTYDSTCLWLSSLFFDRLTDTTTPTVIPEEDVSVFKYYDKNEVSFTEHGFMLYQCGESWHNAEGRHISFEFGSFCSYFHINGRGEENIATFWPLAQYADKEGAMSTKFEGLFSRDYDSLYCDVKLTWDSNGDGSQETILDSCKMTYHKLR